MVTGPARAFNEPLCPELVRGSAKGQKRPGHCKMAVQGLVGASDNAVGSRNNQSRWVFSRNRAFVRPHQLLCHSESARRDQDPAIEMLLDSGRQLPVDSCPIQSYLHVACLCPSLTSSFSLPSSIITYALGRHGNDRESVIRWTGIAARRVREIVYRSFAPRIERISGYG